MTDKFKQYRLDNGELYAWISVDEAKLSEPVPEEFPNATGRSWRNYSSVTKLPNNEMFILVGEHDINGNRKEVVTDAEFELWQKHFIGSNIWCYAEAVEYMRQFTQEM